MVLLEDIDLDVPVRVDRVPGLSAVTSPSIHASCLVDDFVPSWSSGSDPPLESFHVDELDEVVPIYSIVSEDSWGDRLFRESETFQLHSLYEVAHPVHSVAMQPPFSRLNPVVQRCGNRSDGSRCRDGAGLGSPLVVDPDFYSWHDPLNVIRQTILAFSASSEVGDKLARLAELCSMQARDADRGFSDGNLNSAILTLQQEIALDVDAIVPDVLAHLTAFGPVENVNLDFAVSAGQPFRLNFISACAFLCHDPDFLFPRSCIDGLVLGDREPLEDCIHFPVKLPKSSDAMQHDFVSW